MSKRLNPSPGGTGIGSIDMRTTPRHHILQRCFVQTAGAPQAAAQPWQCVAYSISATGLGVTLPVRLPEKAVLTIHAWSLPRAAPLRVRIVHQRQVEFLWFAGCELLTRLSEPELHAWCSGPTDWVDDYKS
jgi:hypothetical protein